MKTTVMSVRVNPAQKQLLKVIASAEGKAMYEVINEMIKDYAKEHKEILESLSSGLNRLQKTKRIQNLNKNL